VKPGDATDGADRVAGKIELVEGLETEQAGAVNGIADRGVLFEHEHRDALGGEHPRSTETGGAAADDQHVPPVR
jgi:hypothetical protein